MLRRRNNYAGLKRHSRYFFRHELCVFLPGSLSSSRDERELSCPPMLAILRLFSAFAEASAQQYLLLRVAGAVQRSLFVAFPDPPNPLQ
jgi:hypothetical protein